MAKKKTPSFTIKSTPRTFTSFEILLYRIFISIIIFIILGIPFILFFTMN